MKTYTIAAMFAAATVCAVAPAYSATVEEVASVADELISTLNEMTTVLSAVQDKDSADAAAPKVTELVQKVSAVKAKADSFGEPTPELQAELKAARPDLEQKLMTAVILFMGAIEKAVGDEENPCYGSSALLEALESFEQQ